MSRHHPCRRRSRGATLVEAVVALAVLAFGMMAFAGLQTSLRRHADVARQRSEATRIAQEAVEQLRSFASVGAAPGIATWDAIIDQPVQLVAGVSGSTTFELARRVITTVEPALKSVLVTVRWQDRAGQAHHIELPALLGGVPPALSGALALSASGSPMPRAQDRHATIPQSARDLGDGRSVFQPAPTVAWVFDNLTGAITAACAGLAEGPAPSIEALAGCRLAAPAQIVSGYVRFLAGDGSAPPPAAEVQNPAGPALNLDLRLTLASTGHPDPGAQCFDDAPTNAVAASVVHAVRYHCIVYPNAGRKWAGRSEIVPLPFADGDPAAWPLHASAAGAYKVCRYSPTAPADGQSVSNADHPATYVDVTGNLVHQNFVVVPAPLACPGDDAVQSPSESGRIHTVAHQPPGA